MGFVGGRTFLFFVLCCVWGFGAYVVAGLASSSSHAGAELSFLFLSFLFFFSFRLEFGYTCWIVLRCLLKKLFLCFWWPVFLLALSCLCCLFFFEIAMSSSAEGSTSGCSCWCVFRPRFFFLLFLWLLRFFFECRFACFFCFISVLFRMFVPFPFLAVMFF